MKSKRLVSILILAVCIAATLGTIGCASKYSVTVQDTNSGKSYILTVDKGEKVDMDMLIREYPEEVSNDTGLYLDRNLYTDETCRVKFTDGIDGNVTLYFGAYSPANYGRIIFEYNGGEYTVFREIGATLTASDFSLSAYGYGDTADYEFYADKTHATPLDIGDVEVKGLLSGDTIVYVGDAA